MTHSGQSTAKRNADRFPEGFMFQLNAEHARGPPLPALRIYRAQGDHGDNAAQFAASRGDERLRGARLHPDPGNTLRAPGTRGFDDARLDDDATGPCPGQRGTRRSWGGKASRRTCRPA